MLRVRRGRREADGHSTLERAESQIGAAAALGAIAVGTVTREAADLGAVALTAVTAGAAALFTLVQGMYLWRRKVAKLGSPRPKDSASDYSQWATIVRRDLRVDLLGLATRGESPRVDDVFVDLRLTRQSAGGSPDQGMADAGSENPHQPLTSYLDQPAPVVLVVVGAPGSGKTTILRHTASRLLEADGPADRKVPILLSLRDQVRLIQSRPESGLVDAAQSTLDESDDPSALRLLDTSLRQGRCVVMFDGLDEVDDTARPYIADWVGRQIVRHSLNDFILTTRPDVDTGPMRVVPDAVLKVEPFDQAQARSFVYRWYRALEHDDPLPGEADSRAMAVAADLWARVRVEPGLASLARTPLALAVIANIHRYSSPLPQNRAEVYEELCRVLLWRRQEAKGIEQRWTGEEIETPLRALAYTMHKLRTTNIERRQIRHQLLAGTLSTTSSKLDTDELLATAVASGVMVEPPGTRSLRFSHQALQDYLTAVHIERTGQSELITKRIDDRWWRETTLLYARHADVNPIVSACLESGGVQAIALATRCALDTTYLRPELRKQLDELTRSSPALPAVPPLTALPPGQPDPTSGILVDVRRLTPTESAVVGAMETIEIHARWVPTANYQEGEAPVTLDVRLLLLADDLEVRPATCRLRLDRDGGPGTAVFRLTPERPGRTELRILLFDEDSGTPLKECQADLDVEIGDEVSLIP